MHKECLLKWKDRCPICRAKVPLTRKERNMLPKTIHEPVGNLDTFVSHIEAWQIRMIEEEPTLGGILLQEIMRNFILDLED